ncbi:MAG: winged helix-turn-helix domain-containing protein [Acidobacteriaceae bacterium]|nr:winged helix-turn-helix domain-containing protein [Acidobacteriaceae bacterium]MBV9779035.1 winged helix-turn-helix domain-containing protein [Acidobacteriaceae bacterium]
MTDTSILAAPTVRWLGFGAFEVDLRERELRKSGVRIKIQRKPFQVLELLLRTPGTLVTRTELCRHLWPDLHVSYDRSLNTAVNVLRQVLGDSSDSSQFIETRPGLGYRFIHPVEEIRESAGSRSGISKRSSTTNLDADEEYLKGGYFYNKMTEDSLQKSFAHFEAALRLDPAHSLARAGLADVHSAFAFWGVLTPAVAHRRAKQLAVMAVELENESAETHASLGNVKGAFEWDWSGAEVEYRRALKLDPSYAEARRLYARHLLALEKSDDSLREIRAAHDLDPLSLVVNTDLAWILYAARDFKGAVEQCWKTLVLDSRFAAAQLTLGLAYEQLGMNEEALTEFQNAHICSDGQPAAVAALGHSFAMAGREHDAEQALSELDRLSRYRYVSPYWRGIIHVGLGTRDLAFESLDQALSERDVWLMWLKVEPRFDLLRSDPRFDRLIRSVGLNQ